MALMPGRITGWSRTVGARNGGRNNGHFTLYGPLKFDPKRIRASFWMQKHIFWYGKWKLWPAIDWVERHCWRSRHGTMLGKLTVDWLIDWSLVRSCLLIGSIDCLINRSMFWMKSFLFFCAKLKKLKSVKILAFLSSQSSNQAKWAVN